MEWGKFEEQLEDLVASGGHSIALANRPSIAGAEWLYAAYVELNSCRQLGMDVGPIPWTARVQYVDRYGLDEYEEDLLTHCIHTLDKVMQEHKK